MLVVYEGLDEVLVTTLDKESRLIDLYFTQGGRDLEGYDRYISDDDGVVEISTRVKVSGIK